MKHATTESLDRIDPVLVRIRSFETLKEKVRGVFYFKSRAFLHFHEDDGNMYADVRLGGSDFERFCIDSSAGQNRLLTAIRSQLSVARQGPTNRSTRSRVKRAPG